MTVPVNALDLTTVAEFVATLGINSPNQTQQDLFQRLISSASVFFQTCTNRIFVRTSYVENRNGTGTDKMAFRYPPVISVTSVSVDGTPIPPVPNSVSPGYICDGSVLYLRGYKFFAGVQNVALSYQAGYSIGAFPIDIVQCVIEMAGRKLKQFDRNGERLGLDSQVTGGMQVNYTKDDLTSGIKAVIDQYARRAPI
jgi:hypothetical protein